MDFIKKVLVLKQVADGYALSGKAVSGIFRIEAESGVATVFLSVINLASAGNGRLRRHCASPRPCGGRRDGLLGERKHDRQIDAELSRAGRKNVSRRRQRRSRCFGKLHRPFVPRPEDEQNLCRRAYAQGRAGSEADV